MSLLEPLESTASLFELMRSRAINNCTEVVYEFLADGQKPPMALTYGALSARAQRIAALLQSCAQPGQRVLLIFPPGLHYITSFWACIYAGCIAVPALVPSSRRTMPRLKRIIEDAQPTVILTQKSVTEKSFFYSSEDAALASLIESVKCLCIDDPQQLGAYPWDAPCTQSTDLAFLQYTSGSTTEPRGVMVSHGNILSNLLAIEQQFKSPPGSTSVSWLPPYHDFGLIGSIITPVATGSRSVLLDPTVFLTNPAHWLKTIERYGAQITGAPNFAFDHCVDRISDDQIQGLDLSCLETIINGAESIRPQTMQRFTQRFKPYGLRENAFSPSYGLAESVLLVTSTPHSQEQGYKTLRLNRAALDRGQAQVDTQSLNSKTLLSVSVGPIDWQGQEILIVQPQNGQELDDSEVGEIWLKGPSVAQGYWGNPELTQITFDGRLRDGRRGYLRTGDLGFIESNQLYITGRLKEVIPLNGRNLYPQDLERIIEECDPAFRSNGCAVFAIEPEPGRSAAVAVQEVDFHKKANTEDLVARILTNLSEMYELVDLDALLLVKPGQLPRTPSGKTQRLACRELYEKGLFKPLWQWQRPEQGDLSLAPRAALLPTTPTEVKLAAIWGQMLPGKTVNLQDNFFNTLGGNSLRATQVSSRIRDTFDIDLPLSNVLQAKDLKLLAAQIDQIKAQSPAPAVQGGAKASPALSLGTQPPKLLATSLPPASYAQQRLWLLEQIQSSESVYNIPLAIRIKGKLDLDALEKSINTIVERHEVLRTHLREQNDRLVQDIAPKVHIKLEFIDLSPVAPLHRTQRLERTLLDCAAKPFDMRTDPMLAAYAVRLESTEHILVFCLHHSVADLWSMCIFVRELLTLYECHTHGRAQSLEPLPMQYREYAQRQIEQSVGPSQSASLAYWSETLKDEPANLTLPSDYPRPAMPSHLGSVQRFSLKPKVVEGLRNLAAAQGATLYMVTLAAFGTLLYRLTDKRDMVIGSPIANRNRPELEELIGFFVNTLAMRVRPAPQMSFTQLLAAVRQTTLAAYAHADLPFDRLVAYLRPGRQTTYTPIFRVMFALQNAPFQQLQTPGLELEMVPLHNGSSKFDLTLMLWEQPKGITAEFEYSTDLFEAKTIERMIDQWQTLLGEICLDPNRPLQELPILSACERQMVLYDFNRTSTNYPSTETIHSLFEKQARATPYAIALIEGESKMSYAQLQTQSNQLACHLIGLGAQPGDLMGLCLGRSIQAVLSMLAILKVGGAYVPLDPNYPKHRLALIVDDKRLSVIITETKFADNLPDSRAKTVFLDDPKLTLQQRPTSPRLPSNADQLAYVIYTSGSSGEPKGVAITHKGVVRLVQSTQYCDFGPDRVFYHGASLTFDATCFELWGPLTNGATVAIAPGGVLGLPEMAQVFQKCGVTTAFLTASQFHLIVGEDIKMLQGLRRLLVGGDTLSPAILRKAMKALPKCTISNNYGPTEACTFVSNFFASSLNPKAGSTPIGIPIANTEMYVLDDDLNVLPVGVCGQLYIGGPALARGYLGRSSLTAENFLPHPYSNSFGARLYRTGDLARRLASGDIDLLGRIDKQIKIRGNRVELQEIEAILTSCPQVEHCIAIAHQEPSMEKTIIAYVVPNLDNTPINSSGYSSHPEATQPFQHWLIAYDKAVVAQALEQKSLNFNFTGLLSTYTHQPLPTEQMNEWLQYTLSRIRALPHGRVWEIGCGSGLLTVPLAKECENYHASDFSSAALALLKDHLSTMSLPQVELELRQPNDFSNIVDEHLDLVVINSVIQYFPSLEYLVQVIEGAVKKVKDGGHIFLGDLRNFNLLTDYLCDEQLQQTNGPQTLAAMTKSIESQRQLVDQLYLSPEVFYCLQERMPRIGSVQVLLKRGSQNNELNRFRFDVILQIGPPPSPVETVPWSDWNAQGLSLKSLDEMLKSAKHDVVALSLIPNSRLWMAHRASQIMAQMDPLTTRSSIRKAIMGSAQDGIDPEALALIAEENGYTVQLRWSGPQHDQYFDALILDPKKQWSVISAAQPMVLTQSMDRLASTPMLGHANEILLPNLKKMLRERLPDFSQPAHVILIDHLPLNVHGKVAIELLPEPQHELHIAPPGFSAASTATELALTEVWSQLLHVEKVGVEDNFFSLGGHSLLASQALARIRKRYAVELTLKQFFLHPTIKAMAALIDTALAQNAQRMARKSRRVSV